MDVLATPSKEVMSFSDSEDLSDDQIQQLLQEAEDRLRAAQSTSVVPTGSGVLAEVSRMPKLVAHDLPKSYLETKNHIVHAEPSRLVDGKQKQLANEIRKVDETVDAGSKKEKKAKATAGPEWFDMPKTNLTPELKRDLQMLKMRSVLDPKRHYKKDNGKAKAPEFSQVGTVIEGPTEFFSARLNNRDRKRTFVEETMADEQNLKRFKSKYADIQTAKTSGKKNHYKALKAKRSKNSKFS